MAPLEFYLQSSLASRKFTLGLLALFGALALVLAVIGIYGVLSYAVTQRTREVGIRVVLGAQRRDFLVMVLRSGLGVIAVGLCSGLLASLAMTRVLAGMLYDVSPTDLATVAAVAVTSYIPARRAMKVDPLVALRYQ